MSSPRSPLARRSSISPWIRRRVARRERSSRSNGEPGPRISCSGIAAPWKASADSNSLGRVDRAGLRAVGVDPEERAQRDAQRDVARPVVEVDHGAGHEAPPARASTSSSITRCAACDPRGGGRPAASSRRCARWYGSSVVSRPSPISGIRSRKWPSRQERFAAPLDEHVMVGLRPEHEDDVVVQDLEREDRPVALVALEQHGQRVADEAVRAPQVERQLAGRERHRRAAVGEDVAGQQRRAGWTSAFGGRRGASPARIFAPAERARPRRWAGPRRLVGCRRWRGRSAGRLADQSYGVSVLGLDLLVAVVLVLRLVLVARVLPPLAVALGADVAALDALARAVRVARRRRR